MSRVMTEAEMARADEADMVREIAYSDALRRLTDRSANPPEVVRDLRSAYHRAARIDRGQPLSA